MVKEISFKKIWLIVFSLLASFPLLPKAVESSLMILFLILSVILYSKRDNKDLKKDALKNILILSSVFIIYCLSSFYSSNYNESLKFIIITSPILMFPLCLGFLSGEKITSAQGRIIKHIYVMSIFLSLLITHFYLKKNVLSNVSNWEYRNSFEDFTKVHGTYFSLWVGFGIIILINELYEQIKRTPFFYSITYLILIGYFLYWQFTLEARLPLFMTLLISSIYIILKLNQKYKIIVSLFLFSLLILILSIKINVIKDKIKFGIPEGNYELKHKEMTSEEIRSGIYYCSQSLIRESWLFGYGIGDVNDKLNLCYIEKIKSDVYQIFHYNSHNQFLQIFLSAGVLGFLFFLYTLFYGIKNAIKNKYQLYVMFNILIIVCFFTENILSRHDGVLFYSYFNTLLFFKINNT